MEIVSVDDGDAIEPFEEITQEQLSKVMLRLTSVYPGEWPLTRQEPYAERLAPVSYEVAMAALRELEDHYTFPSVKALVDCLAYQQELVRARAAEARGEACRDAYGNERTVERLTMMREITRPRGK